MSERRTRPEGWGREDLERSWWRRGYDPIGRHTMVAVVLGVLFAALIGAALDPLNLRTADDLRRAEMRAYDQAYADIEADGYADGVPYGEVQQMGAEIVVFGAPLVISGKEFKAADPNFDSQLRDIVKAVRQA